MKTKSYYPLDRITTLPQPILETILCLVPIKDAVRTSILSRSWRYNWTTIPKLVFNEKEMFNELDYYCLWTRKRKSKIIPAIHQLLSMYQGPILEFSLTMTGNITLDEKMDQIIAYLSKYSTVKKLTLEFDRHPVCSLQSSFYSLPSSFYSLYRLTNIYLHNLEFYPIPTFKGGFPSLKILHVYTGSLSGKSLGHLLSISPVLKSFTLMINPGVVCYRADDPISMFEICKYLSLIEHVSICMSAFQVFHEEAPPELPILVHLKYLYLHSMRGLVRSLHSLVLLIRSSPNLEKIKLQPDNPEMELQRTPSAKCLSVDRISTLPSTIIENILCLVPIKDAVRTSILSRNWRYNWVKIPKLAFNEKDMFDNLFDKNPREHLEILIGIVKEPYTERKKMNARLKVFYAIYQVLLQHEGPIHEFTLSMDTDNACIEIDQIIAYLCRKKTVKKFTLDLTYVDSYHLPQSFYSLHQLTDVYLRRCSFDYGHTFKEFPILTSLYLKYVRLDVEILVRLLSNSPSLKSFSMVTEDNNLQEKYTGDGSFYDMFKYLPVIEHLTLSMWVIWDHEDEAPQELPSALVHLKDLCLQNMLLFDKRGFSLIAHLIRISPNLEKIKLQLHPISEGEVIRVQDYSDIWLQHLNELEIEDYVDFELELEFVKLILVKSPVLKKVRIVLNDQVTYDDEVKMLRILLCSPRASPILKIYVEHRP